MRQHLIIGFVVLSLVSAMSITSFAPGFGARTDSFQSPTNQDNPIEIIRLRHADASDVVSAVIDMLNIRPEQGVELHVVGRSNSILASADTDRMRGIRELIERLDQPADIGGPSGAVKIFQIQHVSAEELCGALGTVFDLVMTYEARTNSIVAQGDEDSLLALQAAIAEMDRPSNQPSADATQLQLRMIWLIEGMDGVDRSPPADLQPVLDELARYGVEDLNLAGQSIARVTSGETFNNQFTTMLAEPWDVQFGGIAHSTTNDRWRMQLFLNARSVREMQTEQTQRGSRQIQPRQSTIEHETTIITGAGQYLVLAMSPTDDMTSIFVIQVTAVPD